MPYWLAKLYRYAESYRFSSFSYPFTYINDSDRLVIAKT